MSDVNKSGLVSVVVASYNHAEYLEQRMDSLINQTYQDIEILVIDDCSTDGSVEVLRKYESHSKVRLIIREKNGGWVTVSNQGVAISSGEFVIFANCDDSCEPQMIERLVKAMYEHPTAGISFCRSLMVDENNHVLGEDIDIQEASFRSRCATNTLIHGFEMSRFLLRGCVIPNLSAALFRADCFENCGKLSSDYRACSDWDIFFRIVRLYDVSYVAEPLNHFRQHGTTIRSAMKMRATFDEYFRVLFGYAKVINLSFVERCIYRTHVMSLWADHLIGTSTSGLLNFPYHFRRVLALDPWALIFFVPGLAIRCANITGKLAAYCKRIFWGTQ